MTLFIFFITVIIIHIILNILFSYAVLSRSLFSSFQRIIYLLCIWILPIFGLVFMYIILNDKIEKDHNQNMSFPPDISI
jgi:hypothetical protein